jgi:hypothetical protein
MVENTGTNPRAVGLLFAGSSSIAVANPIGEVLDHFGVTLVGVGGGGGSTSSSTNASNQGTAHAIDVQTRHSSELVRVPGAVGHAVGVPENSNAAVIKVYVAEITDRARQAVPNQLEGVTVILEAVGQVVALGAPAPCPNRRR